MKRIAIGIFISCFFAYCLSAQEPCNPTSKNLLYYTLNFVLDSSVGYPPLHTDMPYDVMIGYIALDSAARTAISTHKAPQLFEFIDRQTYNDTLRTIMRYRYKMIDYNPVVYYDYLYGPPDGYVPMVNIDRALTVAIGKSNPLHQTVAFDEVFNAYWILHIRVDDTLRIKDRGLSCEAVTAASVDILDTIKGRVFPMRYSNIQPYSMPGTINPENVYPSNKLIIQYCNEWRRGNIYGNQGDQLVTLVDSNGAPLYNPYTLVDSNDVTWLKPGKEYIVFLHPEIVCISPFIAMYISIDPYSGESFSEGMYPIENGIVFDEGNEFGLGQYVPVSEFKNNIRQRINEIIHYGE